jgi:copper chaperone CopZ
MNKTRFSLLNLAFLGIFFFSTLLAADLSEAKIKVSGSCGMCKKTIEKAARAAGAEEANWDKETGILLLKYDPAKSDSEKIQKKISDSGYDTEKFKADDKVYNKLKKCCKYER